MRPHRRQTAVKFDEAGNDAELRLYLDTSGYLWILLAEDGWKELARQTEEADLLSSVAGRESRRQVRKTNSSEISAIEPRPGEEADERATDEKEVEP